MDATAAASGARNGATTAGMTATTVGLTAGATGRIAALINASVAKDGGRTVGGGTGIVGTAALRSAAIATRTATGGTRIGIDQAALPGPFPPPSRAGRQARGRLPARLLGLPDRLLGHSFSGYHLPQLRLRGFPLPIPRPGRRTGPGCPVADAWLRRQRGCAGVQSSPRSRRTRLSPSIRRVSSMRSKVSSSLNRSSGENLRLTARVT